MGEPRARRHRPGSCRGWSARRLLRLLQRFLRKEPFGASEPAWLETIIEALDTDIGLPQPVPSLPAEAETRDFRRLIADVATGLWRIRRRMVVDGALEPSDEMRRASRHVEALWDTLAEANVEICDHTGERYVTGMALKVVAFQSVPGAEAATISETIKPSVFHQDTLIQGGEVIVATPEKRRVEQQPGEELGRNELQASQGTEAEKPQRSAADERNPAGDENRSEGSW